MYLILLDVAKLASKMTVSVDTPTNSVEDNMDFGVGRSELNPASHLTAVEPSFSVPIGNMRIMLWIQEGHVKCAAQGGDHKHSSPSLPPPSAASPTELLLAILPAS